MAILLASVFTVAMPFVADRLGLPGVFVLRLLTGLAEGSSYPAMHTLLSRWAPPLERTRLTAISYSGAFVGTIVALGVGGLLGAQYQLNFYLFGGSGIAWSFMWFALGSTPHDSASISKTERDLILSSFNNSRQLDANLRIPWKAIFTNLPVNDHFRLVFVEI